MSSPRLTPSPTGRLSVSQPEIQFFPGTPQALVLSRKLRLARENSTSATSLVQLDYTELELRVLQAQLDSPR